MGYVEGMLCIFKSQPLLVLAMMTTTTPPASGTVAETIDSAAVLISRTRDTSNILLSKSAQDGDELVEIKHRGVLASGSTFVDPLFPLGGQAAQELPKIRQPDCPRYSRRNAAGTVRKVGPGHSARMAVPTCSLKLPQYCRSIKASTGSWNLLDKDHSCSRSKQIKRQKDKSDQSPIINKSPEVYNIKQQNGCRLCPGNGEEI